MSIHLRCRDCGWKRFYRRPVAARRAAARHICSPPEAVHSALPPEPRDATFQAGKTLRRDDVAGRELAKTRGIPHSEPSPARGSVTPRNHA